MMMFFLRISERQRHWALDMELIKGLPIGHPSLRKQANLVSLEVGAQ